MFITLDCGISNFKEVKSANKLGFEVIIIDHHEVLNHKLPQASAIVDPKQKGDKYPFKEFATVGIVFILVKAIFSKKIPRDLNKNLLQLVALGTIGDMMIKKEENEVFIEEGLKYLKQSPLIGIKALFNSDYIKKSINFNQKVIQIISLLNIRDVENNLPASFRLLTNNSLKEAGEIVKNF